MRERERESLEGFRSDRKLIRKEGRSHSRKGIIQGDQASSLLTLSQLTVQPSSPDAETDDAGDPVQELCGKQDGERLVKEHAFGETLKERKKCLWR